MYMSVTAAHNVDFFSTRPLLLRPYQPRKERQGTLNLAMSQLPKMDTSYGDTTVTTPDSSRDPPGSASERETDLLGKAEAGSEDDHHQYLTTSNFLALLALSATYVGLYTSHLPVEIRADSYKGSNLGTYFIGATVTFIETDLNVGSNTTWLLIGGNLAFACVAPCAGYLQDIFGRRTALIVGSLGNILGAILTGAANGFAMAITGLIISGIGGAIGELTATAAYDLSSRPRTFG